MRLARSLLLVVSLMIAVAPISPASRSATQAMSSRDFGRAYTQWFYDGGFQRLWDRFSPSVRQVFGDIHGLRAFRAKVRVQAGKETGVAGERTVPILSATIYNRAARFSKSRAPVWVQWTLDSTGVVLAFSVQPAARAATSRYLSYQTRTPLRLPFAGRWFVFWGGRTILENYHAVATDQRFAYDFVIARNGRGYAGKPTRNQDYFCFGEPVLAPAAGIVIAAVDGVPDNAPGRMNAQQPLGNHVILDHGNGEYSFFAHLRHGSVRAEPEQKVESGEMLGRSGNSGRSSEPHLHYHLQDSPEFGQGLGLPAQFLAYRTNAELVARGEPARGQYVAPR